MLKEHIYHLYPLGFTGANQSRNDAKQVQSLRQIETTIEHMQKLNVTTLLLGPVFQSESHGYDTVDYNKVDDRLGQNEDLKQLVITCHNAGIKVMLDCVFNHIARGHMIFQDIVKKREASDYKKWINEVDFTSNNSYHDGFSYGNWDGHDHLVKLNLAHKAVREFLINTGLQWIEDYNIDGLRMDAADVMDQGFLRDFSRRLKLAKEDFMLLGEVVHGDYNKWLKEGELDAITNYEAYKGLYSSLNDRNYYEIAYTLSRQFGQGGIYPMGGMVNFVDNHDVNRVASRLENKAHLYPLYIMLYTMPGIPSMYYGSEFGQEGVKVNGTDAPLRPTWDEILDNKDDSLEKTIQKLSKINLETLAIREGGYEQVHIDHQVIGYKRKWTGEDVYVFINAKDQEASLPLPMVHGMFYDVLNDEEVHIQGHITVYQNWGRILVAKK